MGEVYQAIDSKLGRSVAIKILPDAFARDADRLARFERSPSMKRSRLRSRLLMRLKQLIKKESFTGT